MTKAEKNVLEFVAEMLRNAESLRVSANKYPSSADHQRGGATWLTHKAHQLVERAVNGDFSD